MTEPRAKYRAKPTIVDGIRFPSGGEAQRYRQLKLREQAGEISALSVHPKFLLQPAFTYQCKHERPIWYEADFKYIENGVVIVEDFKGYETPVFKLKRKLFLFQYGHSLDFRIVKA